MKHVRDIMSAHVVSVSPSTRVSAVVAVTLCEHFSVVPVTEHGTLVGLVREVDLMHRHEIRCVTSFSRAPSRGSVSFG